MGSETQSPARGADDGEIERLVAEYIDRYNLGESLSPELILTEHPRLAAEVLAQLEAFLDIDGAGGDPGLLREVGDFRLVRRLGSGGMGVVYEAWEEALDRKVAVKLLPAGAAANGTTLRRFLREARAAGRLNHRNVVSVYAMGLAAGTPYYSMEYVDGETLAALRTRLGIVHDEPRSEITTRRALIELISVLPEADARKVNPTVELAAASLPAVRARYARAVAHTFAEVARGLQHAHEGGIVHRDIKPSNLILERDSQRSGTARSGLRILDFGLARLSGDETVTVDGALLGTPLYMSPEQVRSALGQQVDVDRGSDIYSLGLCLYEMLAWRHPFGAGSGEPIHQLTLEREPPPLAPLVHRDLDAIVSKCLRKVPRERYATAEALAQDLDRFVRSEPVEAEPLGPWRRGARRLWSARRRVARTAVLLVFATGAALGGYQFFSGGGAIRTASVWEGEASMSYTRVSLDGSRMVAVDWEVGNLAIKDLHSGQEWFDVTHNRSWDTLTHYGNGAIISPDGTEVCYCWEDGDTGRGELYILAVDGGGPPRRLDPGDTSYYPEDWSRDGARVLVQRHCFRSRKLLSGCSLVLLSTADGAIEWEWHVPGSERLLHPRLSPDGQWVLHQREEKSGSGRWDILAHHVSTNETFPFLRDPSNDRLVGISPDGNQVVFISDRGGSRGLWTAEFDSGRLVGDPRCVERAFDGGGAGITSDGTLYFTQNMGGPELFLTEFDEDGHLDLARAQRASHRFQRRCHAPAWSPDGGRLAYRADPHNGAGAYTNSDWKLVVQEVSTGEEREVHPDPALPGAIRMIGPYWLDDDTLAFMIGELDASSTFYAVDLRERKLRRVLEVTTAIGLFDVCVDSRNRAIWYAVQGRGIYRLDVPVDLAESERSDPRRIVELRGGDLKVSSDGEWLAFMSKDSIWRVRSDGSEKPRIVCAQGDGPERFGRILSWREDHGLIVLAAGEVHELNVESGKHWPIATKRSGECVAFSVSHDRVAYCWETNLRRISKLRDFLR